MREFLVDPRVFILPPFIDCPFCGKHAFGVLNMFPHSYTRRCKECLRPYGEETSVRFELPALSKKVIYLDQFAVSDMAKAINPHMKANQQGKVDSIWLELFKKVERLAKLQLIVCPDSSFHQDESMLSEHFGDYRSMYQHLSGGVSFHHKFTIWQQQICPHAHSWISGEPIVMRMPDAKEAIDGDLTAWRDRTNIVANVQRQHDIIQDYQSSKQEIHEGLSEVFERWQQEGERSFDEWFEDECLGFGKGVLQSYERYLAKQKQVFDGLLAPDMSPISPPLPVSLVRTVQEVFRTAGVEEEEMLNKTIEYFLSPAIRHVPFIRLRALLGAALAMRAARGKRRPPKASMSGDIDMISALLPYCDAMLLDQECRSLLQEPEVKSRLGFAASVFSLRYRDEFIEYLDSIEAGAGPEHIAKVLEVYGEGCLQPFTSLYTYKDNSATGNEKIPEEDGQP